MSPHMDADGVYRKWPAHPEDFGDAIDPWLAYVGRAKDLLIREATLAGWILEKFAEHLRAGRLEVRHRHLVAGFVESLGKATTNPIGKYPVRGLTLLEWIAHEFAAALREGRLGRDQELVVAEFFEHFAEARDHRVALAVIGREDLIRPGARAKDEDVRWHETREVYEYWIDMGLSDADALRQAWDTWTYDPFSATQKSFEQESRRPAGAGKTAYQQQIELLKSRLNKAGSRVPAKKGRKPKVNKN